MPAGRGTAGCTRPDSSRESDGERELSSDGERELSSDGERELYAVCCELDAPSTSVLCPKLLRDGVMGPHARHRGRPHPVADGEFVRFCFLYSPADQEYPAHAAALAALEFLARVRNFCVAHDVQLSPRASIALIETGDARPASCREEAARRAMGLVACAKEGEVVADEGLAQRLAGDLSYSYLDRRAIEGHEELAEVSLVSLHGLQNSRPRMLIARRAERKIIGRQGLRLALRRAIADGLAGRGGMLALCGPSGAGKTFLLSETTQAWIRSGGYGYLMRCRPATQGTCFAPLLQLLERLAGLCGHEHRETRVAAVIDLLRECGLDVDAHPELGALIAGRKCERNAASKIPWRFMQAAVHAFVDTHRGPPLLLIIEDLHYADRATLRLLASFSHLAESRRVLVLLSYRPHRSTGSLRRSGLRELSLEAMQTSELVALALSQARVKAMCPALADYFVEHSRGNPGRLVQLVALFARGSVTLQSEESLHFAPQGRGLADAVVASGEEAGDELSSLGRALRSTSSPRLS